MTPSQRPAVCRVSVPSWYLRTVPSPSTNWSISGRLGGRGPRESKYAQLPVAPIGVVPTRYYVSLYVDDRPGVLSSVAAEFAKREVSIAEVRQEGIVGEDGQRVGARVAVLTHQATDAALSETVAALADLDAVTKVNSVLRMEGAGE